MFYCDLNYYSKSNNVIGDIFFARVIPYLFSACAIFELLAGIRNTGRLSVHHFCLSTCFQAGMNVTSDLVATASSLDERQMI